ncbi:hypothetical protein PpBr36_07444 [Pyricularia pennisetigena]|uniref:hypothetical protein n=1 Tax=Pyricularia pennisetigena TaxID=1578925 RepID=UPI0011519DCE|nr:hypothetical protein PpBr36_07444 [Pyricularia pennisetigena]TLS25745.1 hypothetical protein PpBr36_07444 [Pyricularia pennisetigena]
MASRRYVPRQGHTEGITHCAYTPNGSQLVTVGSNNTIRCYKTGSDGEPKNIDDCGEQNVAVAATDRFFVVGSEDGTVSLFSLETHSFETYLLRTSLPIRDIALSSDGKWCAVAGDELTVKIVSTTDNTVVRHAREHGKPTKHVSFDPKGSTLTLSCTDGVIYIYSLTSEQPELIRKVDGILGSLDMESEASGRVVWHPDGRAFAVPTPTRDIQVVSKNDWEKQRVFANGHEGDITAMAWSPNGSMIATAAKDGKLLIWESRGQSVIARHSYANIMDIVWHPKANIVSFTTFAGEVFICADFVTADFTPLLQLPLQASPFIHDPLAEVSINARRPAINGSKEIPSRPRRDSLNSLDSFANGIPEDEDDFVVDDDGAGYTLNSNGKRPYDGTNVGEYSNKRPNMLRPQYHEAFQPGSTPWRGNRKYLCLNLIGFVWTVDQDSHHTVTVEFYDHELHRDFHFTDTFLYDKACLSEHGTLFSCPPRDGKPAVLFYRPHETWTQRNDWRTQLPADEAVLAMSLSDSFVTVTTTAGYVRVFTLFGVPYRVYRPKSFPMVTCASWKDYVLTMGNGPVGADGNTRLLYSIEDVKRDEICQNEDTVALPEGATVKSVFFSDDGDPCIYDSTGTLLTLLHWRQPSRASWVPLLDTKLLPRLASGRKHESYYPIAVADHKFHCIILKGGDQYPYFPRPLLSEFEFSVPLASAPSGSKKKKQLNADGAESSEDEEEDKGAEAQKLDQQFLLRSIRAAQVLDLLESSSTSKSVSRAQQQSLARLELEIDKTLLQMLAVECREGEERGMRALEMVSLMRDRSGRMIEAACKVAERYGRTILGDKIRELGEKMVRGEGDDDMDEDDEF